MPTDSPLKSSDDILKDVLDGKKYPELFSKANFQAVLNQFIIDLECDESKKTTFIIDSACATPEGKNLFIHVFLKGALEQNNLNNAFDFFTKYILDNKNTLPDEDIKKLITLGTHYTTMYEAKINDANAILTKNDVITTTSFISFLSSLFNIHNITEFESRGLIHQKVEGSLPNITFGDPQKIDTLVKDTIKLSEDLTQRLDFKRYSYEKVSAQNFLGSLGRLGFELKLKEEFQDDNHRIPAIARNILSSTNSTSFSKEDRGEAAYTFLSEFNDKNEKKIKDDCADLGLEDCPRPVTASTRLFQQIARGNYTNQKPSFADYAQVESEIKANIHTLDREQYTHILTFLKNALKTSNGSENTFNFKNLYRFAFNSVDNLSTDLQQKNRLDESFAQAAESLSFFLFNIVKNNVNNQDLLDQVHIITQFSYLFENIIRQAPHLNSLLDTMGNHLFSILARNIDSIEALQTGHREFIKIIKDLNQVCRENRDACNLSKILAGSFKSLGSMSRKSSGYTLNATKEAKALIETSRTHLSPEQLSDSVSFFFKANITKNELIRQCKQKFNLTGCRPASKINLDDLADGGTAAIETSRNDTALSNSEIQIGAPAGYGAGMGAYNAIMRHFYPNSVMLNIVGNAAFAASFPLMLFGLQEYMGSDTQDQNQLTWLDMAWQIPTNFGHAMVWNTGLYLVNVAANDISSLVSNSTRLQFATKHIATNTLPFVATVASVIKKPIETGVQMGASMASSSITSGLLNRFFPRKKIKTSDIEAGEKKDVEMQKLASPSETTSDTSKQNNTENFPHGKKLMYFIQEQQIENIQTKLNDIKLNLEHMINIYNPVNEKLQSNIQNLNKTAKETNTEKVTTACLEEISTLNNIINDNDAKLKLINSQKSILDRYIDFFSDSRHLQACEGFSSAEKLLANEHVKSLWGLIRTTMDNNVLGKLEKDLCKITGTDPTKLITGPDSSKNIEKLGNYISVIRFSSSQAESILKGALRIYESKEQGVTAAKKLGGQNTENEVNLNMVHGTATLRKKTNGILTNRAYSMYSDRTRSSESDTSNTSGNSEFDPLVQQQERELIRIKI
ncbi:MAG: hypothetical protein RJA83_1521 [Pseudomonadota bacterium]|jgi:hypothetical protein